MVILSLKIEKCNEYLWVMFGGSGLPLAFGAAFGRLTGSGADRLGCRPLSRRGNALLVAALVALFVFFAAAAPARFIPFGAFFGFDGPRFAV